MALGLRLVPAIALLAVSASAWSDGALAAAPDCRTPASAIGGLAVQSRTARQAGIDPEKLPAGIYFNDAQWLTGRCAASVSGHEAGTIFLRGNVAVRRTMKGSLAPAVPFPASLLKDDLGASQMPRGLARPFAKAQFRGAAFVDARPGNAAPRHFVALWSAPGRSVITTFAQIPGKGFVPTGKVLELPVRAVGIGYFPGVDSQSGVLGLTIAQPGGTLLLSLSWGHTGLLDRAS